MSFCDYCQCSNCQNGVSDLYHALTENDKWICEICYCFDLCTSGPTKNPNGPCEEKDCRHRPKLKSDWEKMIIN